jgi:RpiR family transcriptional regulator, carbohydrate utilization regulator
VPLYGDFLEGRINQLFLIDILYIGLLFEDRAGTSRHLDSTGAALEKYFRSSPPKSKSPGRKS